MSYATRYDIELNRSSDEPPGFELVEHKYGDYVQASEHIGIVDELRDRIAQLEQEVSDLTLELLEADCDAV